MASHYLNRRELREQAKSPEPAERNLGIALVSFSQGDAARRSCLSVHHSVHPQLVTEETATTLVEPDEVLVADPRGGLTPTQMVDQKLLTLLGGHPDSCLQATGRPENIRRIPTEQRTLSSPLRPPSSSFNLGG